jgi:ARG and Rhodanese-Phosphatase-superfamily-associated Protein domain
MKFAMPVLACAVCLLTAMPESSHVLSGPRYNVLSPITQNNLTVFPVVAARVFDTSRFITLDEGIASGRVVITERTGLTNELNQPDLDQRGLVRPRFYPPSMDDGIWSERPPQLPERGARVNELTLTNHSDNPLLLLAGEIVMGGKQDRVVSRDRIILAHSNPVALDVFCVEPRRWRETSTRFGVLGSSMAQPSVRFRAMADQDQQGVWNEVARSRASFAAGLAAAQATVIESTSSYAGAMQSEGVQRQLDSMVIPMDRMFDKLRQQLRSEKAVGVVVALNGELVCIDVFASPSLLDKYWPKLIRSYAAEAFSLRAAPLFYKLPPTIDSAQDFLDRFEAKRESVNTEPGVYRNTELAGYNFHAFILTALLPNTGFNVHIAKMKRK